MKKSAITILYVCALLMVFPLSAQKKKKEKKVDPEHENHFAELNPVETSDYSIEFSDVHCQMDFAIAKMKITNKTNDYLIIDMGQIEFVFDWGTVKNKNKREVIINPKDSKTKTAKVDGDNRFHVEKFTLKVNGIQKVPTTGTAVKLDDFRLPPAVNTVSSGSTSVNMSKMKKVTDITDTRFEMENKGSNYIICNPSKIATKFPSGNVFANSYSKSRPKLVKPGKSDKFNVVCEEQQPEGDMQFIELNVVWNDAFVESKAVAAASCQKSFELDEAETVGKN